MNAWGLKIRENTCRYVYKHAFYAFVVQFKASNLTTLQQNKFS